MDRFGYHIQKLDGREPIVPAGTHERLNEEFWPQAKAGCYKVLISRELPDKSHKQVKTVFGLVIGTTLAKFDEFGWDTSTLIKSSRPSGVAVSKELLKEYLYLVCPVFGDNGKRLTLSKMNVKQAKEFIDNVRNYISAEWGIYIPEPNPNWRTENGEL